MTGMVVAENMATFGDTGLDGCTTARSGDRAQRLGDMARQSPGGADDVEAVRVAGTGRAALCANDAVERQSLRIAASCVSTPGERRWPGRSIRSASCAIISRPRRFSSRSSDLLRSERSADVIAVISAYASARLVR